MANAREIDVAKKSTAAIGHTVRVGDALALCADKAVVDNEVEVGAEVVIPGVVLQHVGVTGWDVRTQPVGVVHAYQLFHQGFGYVAQRAVDLSEVVDAIHGVVPCVGLCAVRVQVVNVELWNNVIA